MKIENQVCSAQQAQRLKELGITAPSLHQWWKMKYPASEESFAKNRANCLITPTGDNHDRFIMHYIDNENARFRWDEGTYTHGWDHSRCELEEGPLAAYNVAELGEMLPQGYHTYNSELGKDKWGAMDSSDEDFTLADGTSLYAETEAEARAAMLIHLLEKKLITPPTDQ
jgi:hypothetical protein